MKTVNDLLLELLRVERIYNEALIERRMKIISKSELMKDSAAYRAAKREWEKASGNKWKQ